EGDKDHGLFRPVAVGRNSEVGIYRQTVSIIRAEFQGKLPIALRLTRNIHQIQQHLLMHETVEAAST
ncbi:MAG TPA: hypothetical protein VFP18_07860, partial [Candidatus Binatia bacterium]|nr:hypothetical protein [Candidatus Binatia bacterium]